MWNDAGGAGETKASWWPETATTNLKQGSSILQTTFMSTQQLIKALVTTWSIITVSCFFCKRSQSIISIRSWRQCFVFIPHRPWNTSLIREFAPRVKPLPAKMHHTHVVIATERTVFICRHSTPVLARSAPATRQTGAAPRSSRKHTGAEQLGGTTSAMVGEARMSIWRPGNIWNFLTIEWLTGVPIETLCLASYRARCSSLWTVCICKGLRMDRQSGCLVNRC